MAEEQPPQNPATVVEVQTSPTPVKKKNNKIIFVSFFFFFFKFFVLTDRISCRI